MIIIIIIGLLLVSFSGLFLIEGYVAFTDKPTTTINIVVGIFSTLIGLLLTYVTVCYVLITLYKSYHIGQTLLVLLGF